MQILFSKIDLVSYIPFRFARYFHRKGWSNKKKCSLYFQVDIRSIKIPAIVNLLLWILSLIYNRGTYFYIAKILHCQGWYSKHIIKENGLGVFANYKFSMNSIQLSSNNFSSSIQISGMNEMFLLYRLKDFTSVDASVSIFAEEVIIFFKNFYFQLKFQSRFSFEHDHDVLYFLTSPFPNLI